MSVLGLPEEFNAPELQIWNNAVFDHGGSGDFSATRACWSNIPPDFVDGSFGSDDSKENQIPVPASSSSVSSLKSAASIIKPLFSANIQGKPLKSSFEALSAKPKTGKAKHGADQTKRREDTNIDAEIEEIEKEISRLSARLELLRLEKAAQTARSIALRGRIVQAKFMEQKQTVKNHDAAVAKVEECSLSSAKSKINRRGVSLGPAEIFSAANSRQPGKPNTMTPLQATQNRRKSCFWRLPDIDEDKATKARGRMSFSLSPNSRKAASRIEAQKLAATTVGSKRAVKKDAGLLSTIQPKRLFQDAEKAVPAKKPVKSGRIVASRYSQISHNQGGEKDARKRSLPENDKEDNNRSEKRRTSSENGNDTCRNHKSEGRVKKRWEIPDEVVVYRSDVIANDETPTPVSKIAKELPKIRTLRCIAESPRDSGPAKRVAELAGRKCYFTPEEDAGDGDAVCQSLSFEASDAED